MSLNRGAGWIRLSACVVLVHGCYGPNPQYLGPSETGLPDGDGATGEATTSPDAGDADAGNASDAKDTGDAGDDGNSSTNCADDIAQPGELCFIVEPVLAMSVQSLAIGDFDENGHVDLVVAGHDHLRVLFGDGSGGFPLQLDLPESDGDYFGAGVGDLDQDGRPDLVFSNSTADRVVFYPANGNKTFDPAVNVSTGDQPLGLILASVDGDDALDVVVADKGTDEVSVLLNQGFAAFDERDDYSTDSDEPRRLVFGHFDSNSTVDLVVANHNGEDLSILLGFGEGIFGDAENHSLAGKPTDIVTADFDLDGSLDVAVAIEDTDSIEIVFGDGIGGFDDEHVELPVGDEPVALALVDLDNDGASDIVVLNRDDSEVGVVFGNADQPGQFLAHQTVVGLGGFSSLSAVAVAELNGDAVPDLAVGGSELRVLISNP